MCGESSRAGRASQRARQLEAEPSMAGNDARPSGRAARGSAPNPPGQDPGPALRLVAAAAWHVVRARQVRDFPRVLGLLEAVGRAAPDAVRFRHYARLRLGLQAAVIMAMVREEQPDGKIYDAVDTYFPEGERQRHPLATDRDLQLVGEAQETFRELVLGLLSDRQQREAYVEEQLEAEYGEPFLGRLEALFYEYLWRLESTLPAPQLQQLQEAAWRECPMAGPLQAPPELSILTQYITDMSHNQYTDSPAQPPGTSLRSQPQAGAGQPEPRMPGSCQRQSREGAAPMQEETSDDHGLHCQSPREQDMGQLSAYTAQHPDPHLLRSPGCPRRVPWLLRSRGAAPAAPSTDTSASRRRPIDPFIAGAK
uniref:TERF1-interacting nuclear factor 2 N-terminal domain-containing protein n=1 Tax=Pelusios castaneus TaxID=367368 RepID=A0A8C8S1M1_9SAUR